MKKVFIGLFAALLIASNFLAISAFAQYGPGNPVYQSWLSYGNITVNPTIAVTSTVVQLPAAAVSGTTGGAGLTAKFCNLATAGADIYLTFGTANTVTAAANSGARLAFGTCGAFNLQPFAGVHYTYMAGICVGPACSAQIYVETGVGTPKLR